MYLLLPKIILLGNNKRITLSAIAAGLGNTLCLLLVRAVKLTAARIQASLSLDGRDTISAHPRNISRIAECRSSQQLAVVEGKAFRQPRGSEVAAYYRAESGPIFELTCSRSL
ncbi:hypothetical protein J6590_017000 [Homalodisca vitripennis]|nr:hypothetical protein J6590_017000 [Homalodisca vitripennis]